VGETSKGDGVIIVPSIIRREGSQETVFNKDRTSIGKTIHSTHRPLLGVFPLREKLLRTKTFDYNSLSAIHKNTQGTLRVGAASVRLIPNHNCGCLFSTLSSTSSASLHPWFITGFADAESCFSVSFFRVNTIKIGWRTQASFQITLHQKDLALLESIRLFFQVGKISDHGKDSIIYQVRSSKDLEVIIAHFDKFPLITQKQADYELFKMAVEVIKNKTHTSVEGLNKLLSLKASINNGLSPALKEAFPKVIPVQRPLVVDQEIKDPNWVSGFASGEGCFNINIKKLSSGKLVETAGLRHLITQGSRDEIILKGLVDYLGCGKINAVSNQDVYNFTVSRISDITDKIIPFYSTYRIEGVKALDFSDFCKAAELIKNKAIRGPEGLAQIRQIKARMNKGRLNINTQSIRRMSIQVFSKCYINPATDLELARGATTQGIRYISSSKPAALTCVGESLSPALHTQGSTKKSLNPWFITGFTDAEGCFMVNILKVPKLRVGWRVQPVFQIGPRPGDGELLNNLQAYFAGSGFMTKLTSNSIIFRIFSLEQLDKVIDHFEQYPLQTKKHVDYCLFKEVVMKMKRGEHLTTEGLQDIINLKATLNKGLTPLLQEAFPKCIPVPRSLMENRQIPDPYWAAGFTSGEGCFTINITKSSASKTGFLVNLRFQISQHSRDEELIRSFIGYLGCGRYYSLKGSQLRVDFVVTSLSDILNKINPFFRDYPILGVKSKDFQSWSEAAELMRKKEHLNVEGLEKIRKIKASINKASTSTSRKD
jgi:hypothetical protein